MAEEMYHLGCREGSVRKYALVFGDPERSSLVHPLLDSYELLSSHRGYVLYNGSLGELELTYGGLGIGGPSWLIGLHELAICGSNVFIRVGTSGIISATVRPGELIVPTEIVSDEGISSYVVGSDKKLLPDANLVRLLENCLRQSEYKYRLGLVHSKDFLYMEEPEDYPLCERLNTRMRELNNIGVLVTEMECAALFSFGMARNYPTAAILAAINGNNEMSANTQQKAIEIALKTLTTYFEAD